MTESRFQDKRGVFSATVTFNKQIGLEFYAIGLEFAAEAAKAFAKFAPGQFAEFDISNVALPPQKSIPSNLRNVSGRKVLLRRPFSFADVTTKKDKTSANLLYKVVGPASLRMTTLRTGDLVSVLGPLGNGFLVPEDKKTAILVIGGIGAPPLMHLAKVLKRDYPDIAVIAFIGVKNVEELPFDTQSKDSDFSLEGFAEYTAEQIVATDDGSFGQKGFVTVHLGNWLEKQKLAGDDSTIIYTCGPEVMLKEVALLAEKYNIDCQVSMERRMACGIGLCQSCAVECRVEGYSETVYKMCCKDGPVFDSREIAFQK